MYPQSRTGDNRPASSPRFCLCSHAEPDHWDTATGLTECMHRACGCLRFRPDPRPRAEDAAREDVA